MSAPDPIETGLRAWLADDLAALETVLAPDVTLRGVESGPWDCTGRTEVMRLLRQRQAERRGRPPYPVHVQRVDERTYTVRSDEPVDPDGPEPFPVATRITVADGLVTAMQQYRADAQESARP